MADILEVGGDAEAESGVEASAPGVAIALDGARHDPGLRANIAGFLDDQRSLISDQRHHLAAQYRQLGLRQWSERFKVALQLAGALAVLSAIIAVGAMLADALGAHGLVVQGFSAPPSLVARGFTSQVVTEEFVSRLETVRRIANANSVSRSDEVRANEAENVKVEVPDTGVSLAEVGRWLRRWLGHEKHMTGSLRDDADGQLSLSLATPDGDPILVRGPAGDVDALLQTAAEKAFQDFDPVNYVLYLGAVGRPADAYRQAEANALREQSQKQRADAYALLAAADPSPARALQRAKLSTEFDPTFMMGWVELASTEAKFGHAEAALTGYRRLVATRRADQLRVQQVGYPRIMRRGQQEIARALGDFASLDEDRIDGGRNLSEVFVRNARLAALRHDGVRARAQLVRSASTLGAPAPYAMADARLTRSERAGDWAQAAIDAQALAAEAQAIAATPEDRDHSALRLDREFIPRLAIAQALSGKVGEAQATIGPSPLDCYLCVRARGWVAEAAGDHAGADRWFAEAVRQAPSLPDADLDWGQVKLARGDAAGALTQATLASQKAPRYADALELSGEALLARGDAAGAETKFAEADRLTPRWGRLHLKWGEALTRLGKPAEARVQFAAAATMDLSPRDRAALPR
jgi:tetratricopeptide (TPR) repeat protein